MSYAPSNPEGYLYYVRLNTKHGTFYKIGFTKMSSVEARYSYGGSEAYKLIDEVFFYKYSLRAYELEQTLHQNMRHRAAYPRHTFLNLFRDVSQHPLFGDGQTELYRDDVLGMDPNPKREFRLSRLFSKPQNDMVRKRLLVTAYHSSVKETEECRIYQVLDDFLAAPYFESKDEFISRHSEWVISLQQWGARNAMNESEIGTGTTVHGSPALPTTREELLRMTELCPQWAHIDSIPKEVKYLRDLVVLRFPAYKVKSVPDEVYELANLRELDISRSSVYELSGRIGNLKKLRVLNVADCENLVTLPPELQTLEHLEKIEISRARYDGFVRCVPGLAHLMEWNPLEDDHHDESEIEDVKDDLETAEV